MKAMKTIVLPIDALARYRPLIDDWGAFVESLARPLPRCLWANPLRLRAMELESLLNEEGLAAEPVPWYPGAFRLPAPTAIGGHWWYLAGLAHCQEEASLVPVRLLDPQPGERILDLCAAPGGKTAQIATAMRGTGTVVANDVQIHRMRALRANLERLGLLNVSLTLQDGAGYPNAAGNFDRVLVDAPCSCEGTLRRHEALDRYGSEISLRYARLQSALMKRAVALCRPGGRIVYSTCTFAPEENEAVVDETLRHFGSQLKLAPARIAGLHTCPGITEWQGRRFDPQLSRCLRLWPHHNDTGGFFAAVLEKSPDSGALEAVPAIPEPVEAPELQRWLIDYYGLPPQCLQDWTAWRRSSRGIHMVNLAHRLPRRPQPEVMGLELLKTATRPPKVTTAGALLLAPRATRQVVDLAPGQLLTYLRRGNIVLSSRQMVHCAGSGFVMVRFRGFGLGTAWLDTATATLESLFPKRSVGLTTS